MSGRVPGENGSRKFALTPAEQAAANREAGKTAREMLGDDWESQPLNQDLADRITDTVTRAQRIERDKLRMEKLAQPSGDEADD